MVRIFSILSVLTAVMLLIAGGGTYWLSKNDVDQANVKTTDALAKGITLGITSQINTLQNIVLKMAKSSEAIEAIASKDPSIMAQTAMTLEQFIPKILKLRLLPADISELDKTSIPHMGNADLIMVQESLSLLQNQRPVIQGQGENRHLAITSVVLKNDEPIGVILASLNFDFLQSTLNAYQIPNGFIELMQKNASLASAGNPSDKHTTANSFEIPETPWSIHFWHSSTTNQTTFLSFTGMVLFPAFLSCLACFIAYQKLNGLLKRDYNSILYIIKDLAYGKNVGSYPMHFDEMESISTKIIQLKHGLNIEENNNSSEKDTNVEELDFSIKEQTTFDPPLGAGFLGTNIIVEETEKKITPVSSNKNSPSLSNSQKKDSLPDAPVSKLAVSELDKKWSIFKANDIRGIAGESLSKEMVFNIGRALGSEAKEQKISTIIVGRDARISSPELAESLTKGIISTGLDVLDLGIIPSPVVYFVAHHSQGKSGVVITGSFNPPEHNGLKIIINGELIAGDQLNKLAQRIKNEDYLTGTEGSVEQNTLFVNEYIGIISEDIHIVRPMKVVIDCGNGASGKLAPTLLKTLGCEVIELFCELDGTFPNHLPNPNNPENLKNLIEAVQQHKADVGIAFDGDGNRLGVVDCKGNIIWPDRLMMLFAKDVLTLKPGSEIIYDVKCSRHLGEQIVKSGGRPLMWKTGHSFIKAKMKETGATLAGEMSGHIFFNDRWFGFDDALYAASRLIEILSADTRNSDEVFSDFPNSEVTPEFIIELTEQESLRIIDQLISEASFTNGKIINIDGMRVEFPDGWGLVRTSNNMPALTLRFEADTKDVLQRIQSQFKELLVKVKPDISLPF